MTERFEYYSTVPRTFVQDCRLKHFNLNLIWTVTYMLERCLLKLQ